MQLLTTRDAARELGIGDRRVRALIAQGRLKATKVGGVLLIARADLAAVRDRPPGNPGIAELYKVRKRRK